ncbi:aspartate aminotransferase [compost metagenome]
MAFCESMLEQAGVAATPGVDFDRINGHSFVRFSYAGTRETVDRALERLKTFVAAGS